MSKKLKGNQPIILHLREVLPKVFPVLKTKTGVRKGVHKTGVGGYVDRKTKDGGFSAHSEGRAADIYLDWHNPYEKQIGDGLYAMFIENAKKLGVKNVIWNKRIWTVSNNQEASYKEGKKGFHRDHIHVEFSSEGSQQRPIVLEDLCHSARAVGVNYSESNPPQLLRSRIASEFVAIAPAIDSLDSETQRKRSKIAVGKTSKTKP